MPRHDWNDDETMSRDRGEWRSRDYGRRDREHSYRDQDRGAFFDRDDERGRGRIGGWGGMRSDGDRNRDRYRERERERMQHRGERDRHDDNRRYGSDDYNGGVPMDETRQLIASNKVEGTPVYDRHGDKLGTVHNFMVDKRNGQVVYAVLKHGGGFLGLGERYYPLEWDQLTYDTELEGYHVRLDEDDLKNFGSFDSEGRYHRRRMRGERERDEYRRDRW